MIEHKKTRRGTTSVVDFGEGFDPSTIPAAAELAYQTSIVGYDAVTRKVSPVSIRHNIPDTGLVKFRDNATVVYDEHLPLGRIEVTPVDPDNG